MRAGEEPDAREALGGPPELVGPRVPPTTTLTGGVFRAGEDTGAGEVIARGGLLRMGDKLDAGETVV